MATEQILLMNPRKGRMPAGLARYWAGKRKKKHRRRRASNPRRHRAAGYTVGHHRVRRRKLNSRRRHRRSNPIFRHHRRRHRNPMSLRGSLGTIKATVLPAAVGGLGAIGLDIAWGYGAQYLPEQFKTGWLAVGAKVVAAMGIGWLLGRFAPVPKHYVRTGVLGAVTVIAYQGLRDAAKSAFPDVKGLGGYQDFIDHQLTQDRNMGAYMPPRLGFYSPAPLVDTGMGAYMSPEMAGMHGYTGSDDGM